MRRSCRVRSAARGSGGQGTPGASAVPARRRGLGRTPPLAQLLLASSCQPHAPSRVPPYLEQNLLLLTWWLASLPSRGGSTGSRSGLSRRLGPRASRGQTRRSGCEPSRYLSCLAEQLGLDHRPWVPSQLPTNRTPRVPRPCFGMALPRLGSVSRCPVHSCWACGVVGWFFVAKSSIICRPRCRHHSAGPLGLVGNFRRFRGSNPEPCDHQATP